MEISEFDYDDIPPFSTITICASRRSGKSVLARDLIYKHFIKKKKIKNIFIVSPTKFNKDYDFLADKFKYDDFNEEFLEKILKRQEQMATNDPEGGEALLVLDDIIKSTDLKTRDMLSKLYGIGRHLLLNIILISQSLHYEVTPVCRLNTDIMILFKSRNLDNKKEIADLWMGFSDKEDRDTAFNMIDSIAQGYRSMIINNTIHTMDPSQIISYYEVDPDRSIPKKFFYEG